MKITWKVGLLFILGAVCIYLGLSGFREGFQAGLPGIRCGVDLPKCSTGFQCMNGFCVRPVLPALQRNQLPVFP